MINILIKDDNALYLWSLQCLLAEIFSQEYQKKVVIAQGFSRDTVSHADIIFIEMCQGELFTCHPELHSRTKGIIIALMDKKPVNSIPLPECLSDVLYIERKAPLEMIRSKIIQAWSGNQAEQGNVHSISCIRCRHRVLSAQQVRIMAGFYQGKGVAQIAHELNVTDKTVFSHKYLMMSKFHLASDHELVKLLGKLHECRLYPHLFKQHCED